MRAVIVDRYGAPEVLKIVELSRPLPSSTEVLVRVRAAGVQPFDTYVRQGRDGFRFDLPHQLGNEFAGTVDSVGEAVEGVAVGDEVLGWAALSSHADYVVTGQEAIVAKPAAMPWDEAGAISASGQTALTALRELRVRPGDTLLVHGAAGGAGSAVVQLARHRGARVIGTASEANHEHLRTLGAVPVAYGPGTVDRVRAAAPDGVNAALDIVGGQALHDALTLVSDRRRIGTLVEHSLADELGVLGIRAQRSTEQLRELVAAHQAGALKVTIRSRHPVEQIATAHREVESGHGRGKVVITF